MSLSYQNFVLATMATRTAAMRIWELTSPLPTFLLVLIKDEETLEFPFVALLETELLAALAETELFAALAGVVVPVEVVAVSAVVLDCARVKLNVTVRTRMRQMTILCIMMVGLKPKFEYNNYYKTACLTNQCFEHKTAKIMKYIIFLL